MEKVRPWCGQPSDRGRLKNKTEQSDNIISIASHVRIHRQVRPIAMDVPLSVVCRFGDERLADSGMTEGTMYGGAYWRT